MSNFGYTGYYFFLTKQSVPDLDFLSKCMDEGKLKCVMDHVENTDGGKIYKFSDDDIKEMMAKLKSNRSKGKLVLEIE